MKVFKKFAVFTILFIIYFFICANNYANAISQDISNSVLRLHIIANSNKVDDQNLKYKVRDNILAYMQNITKEVSSKEEIIKIVSSNLETFKEIAQNTVFAYGYNYNVNVELGNFKFPTKTYGDISFPPGFYDALRIKIGNAKGENWWCVMFPPLCFIDVSSGIVPNNSKEILQSELSKEEYELISEESNETQFKFKIMEVLQNLKFSGIFM